MGYPQHGYWFSFGQVFPELGLWINGLQAGDASIPMGIYLFLLMYPTMVNIEFIVKAAKPPKPIILTLIDNWVVAPALMALIARLFLYDYPEYAAGVILLGLAPCTGMVLFWILLAQGDVAKGVVITAINALSTLLLYTPLAAFYLGVGGVSVPVTLVVKSVVLFVGLPLALGQISRKVLLDKVGKAWFENRLRTIIGNVAAAALLATIVILFSLKGEVIASQPLLIGLISIPLLVHFLTMAALFYIIAWLLKFDHSDAVTTAFISSSTQFEVAVATATVVFGLAWGPLWRQWLPSVGSSVHAYIR